MYTLWVKTCNTERAVTWVDLVKFPSTGDAFSVLEEILYESKHLKCKPSWEGFIVKGYRIEPVTASADMNPALMINSHDEIPSITRHQSCFVCHRRWLVVERFAVEQLPRTIPGGLFLTKYIVRFQSLRQNWWMARVMLGTGRRIENVDSIFHGKKMTFQGGCRRSLNRSQSRWICGWCLGNPGLQPLEREMSF